MTGEERETLALAAFRYSHARSHARARPITRSGDPHGVRFAPPVRYRMLRLPQKGGEVLELNQNRSESTRGLCRHPNDSTHDAAAVRDFSPAYVRFGSGVDISRLLSHVRFAPQSGHRGFDSKSPLCNQKRKHEPRRNGISIRSLRRRIARFNAYPAKEPCAFANSFS